MKRNITRFLISAGTALFLVLSAWTTVSAAKATSRFLASKLIDNAGTPTVTATTMDTSTPVVAGTQPASDNEQDESVSSGTTNESQFDEDNDEGNISTSGITSTPQMGEDDSEEHDSHPAMIGTPQPWNGGDEHRNSGGSGSGDSDNGGGDD